MIKLENVSKTFPGSETPAIKDVSFDIGSGIICVFVGPSGCGKTTIMRMINRLVEPSSGDIFIDGKSIRDINSDELRRQIGYVIQQIGLLPHRTIEQNVAIVPRLLKWPEEKIKKRVNELFEIVGLKPGEVSRKYPYQLSGGQMQRVGVARAMAADPPVMLMDEPFGAVDPIVRSKLQDEFLKLQQEVKKTICFVTHDINEAIKMGDDIVILNEGKLIQKGAPMDILSSPANSFVEELIGDDRGVKLLDLTKVESIMNRLNKTAVNSEESTCVVQGYQPVKLALEVMMKNNTDQINVCEGETVKGSISWSDIKNHINKISGGEK